jgi:hypothetical protein
MLFEEVHLYRLDFSANQPYRASIFRAFPNQFSLLLDLGFLSYMKDNPTRQCGVNNTPQPVQLASVFDSSQQRDIWKGVQHHQGLELDLRAYISLGH